ncbi:sulfur oxidation c-type cytochrome SoxA [Tropicimonas isoalkanivorans]|uniref:SoxAX cytochrome complex subunit A n=1 Tax=Tropicimonas isoalkanivorans TaxID=441112 RepID=A0A1I1P695_9RHOB|nr:sulfur oxidation c-type cytochrome SoxA [Tropicimonas isoalkanivorans]SFD05454.1 sulfur-oxidizing protein SoxA [Tropicimonas isoalkanivorans]
MRFKAMTAFAGALAISAVGAANAEPVDDELVINEDVEIVTKTDAPEHMEYIDEVMSGWLFREDDTRDMQRDDFDNPGMLGVEAAMETWDEVDGTAGKACSDCHGTIDEAQLAGARAVYPKWNENAGEVWTIETAMNACRTERMGAEAWDYNGSDMINMSALMSYLSRGMPMNVAIDGPAAETWEKGKEIYYTRYGQLELACANCHEDHYGDMIRADHLSQGQSNGFPAYRLKDAKLVGLHNRFKGCIRDTRAEPFAIGSPEFVALELYVASRGNGLSVEGPSVRN